MRNEEYIIGANLLFRKEIRIIRIITPTNFEYYNKLTEQK